VNALATIRVDRGEDRRVVVDAEEVLIERDLRRVLRISLVQAVVIERAPALGVNALAFPQARETDVADLRAVDQDAVGVTGQQAAECRKPQPIIRCEFEAGVDEVLARPRLKVVSAIKDVAQPRRMFRIAHPVELDSAHTGMADGAGAEIAARRFRNHARVDQRVECDADR
jgi:hypothetical protein